MWIFGLLCGLMKWDRYRSMAPHGTLFLRCLVHSLRQRTSPDSGDWLCDDVVGWKGDVNHQFTVKSGYWLRAAIPEDNSDKAHHWVGGQTLSCRPR
ncbi:hypothetical protein V6N12_022638 [Hibiscus sabdariffa]|uniref:Uncharacterized protein n=1 Tax=Hibiscus sabdariffa TaxID=183260 RepID=A0ABR2FVE2_9ROSI